MSQQETSPIRSAVHTADLSERGLASQPRTDDSGSWLAVGGGILGALAASSCCLLPLALTLFGVSGAWMANLRALAPYQPYFIGISVLALGYGFYQVYRKPKVACADGDACARPMNNRLVKSGLWLGTFIMLSAVTFSFWFPVVLPYLP